MQCDLGLRDMTLGQGHDTPLGHGQQLCEILSRSSMAVKSYGPDTHILLCVHFDLDLGGPCIKVIQHTWVMDNDCVKYPDPTWQ